MAVHGDILEIAYTHPSVGSGRFFAIANQSNTLDDGGIRNADEENGIAGDGSLVITKTRSRGKLEVIIENDMNIRNDAVEAGKISASSEFATWTVTMINGAVWKGTGTIVGEIKPDVSTGQFTLMVACPLWEKTTG